MKNRFVALVVMVAIWAAVQGVAQERPSAWRVKSQKVERVSEGVFLFTGSVDAATDEWRIRADSLEVRSDTPTAQDATRMIAEGSVVFERGEERLRLRRLEFEPKTGRGVFELR